MSTFGLTQISLPSDCRCSKAPYSLRGSIMYCPTYTKHSDGGRGAHGVDDGVLWWQQRDTAFETRSRYYRYRIRSQDDAHQYTRIVTHAVQIVRTRTGVVIGLSNLSAQVLASWIHCHPMSSERSVGAGDRTRGRRKYEVGTGTLLSGEHTDEILTHALRCQYTNVRKNQRN